MALSVLPKRKLSMFINLILIAIASCCYSGSYAADNPAEALAKGLLCFNIYTGCDGQYRLNESGNINVPYEATDSYCNGPCFEETQVMLDCVEKLVSNFIFYNKATVKDIRKAVNSGCSYTNERGDFNVWRYIDQGDTSLFNGQQVPTFNGFSALAMLTGSCLLIW